MDLRTVKVAGSAALAIVSAVGLVATPPAAADPCPPKLNTIISNEEEIWGTPCDDQIVAGPDVQEIHALAGNDIVKVQGNATKNIPLGVMLGDGNDKVTSARVSAITSYRGEGGSDWIETFSTAAQKSGGQQLEGGPGDDRLVPAGHAFVDGGAGNDHVTLKPGAAGPSWAVGPSRVFGQAGNDLIDSHLVLPEDMTFVMGLEGAPDMWAWPELHGGVGNDTFLANQGDGTNAEHIFGDAGSDTATVDVDDELQAVEIKLP